MSSFKTEINEALDGQGIWGSLVVKILIFLVLVSTASFALSTVDELKHNHAFVFDGIEYFCTVVFTIEYALRVWVAPNKCQYVIQLISLIDLLAVLPSWIDLFVPGDNLPGLQFLRMLRLFKFLSSSKAGGRAAAAFNNTWKENQSLLVAASFAGISVWLVTASLQYLAEQNNPEMEWCYPKDGVGDKHCVCTDDGCTGSACICENRFGSIPSSMFFVLLNLSGEFPLTAKHSTWGRLIAACTAVVSVGIFAIPTGLVAAALEDSVNAMNSGAADDYDVDEDDVQEIAEETKKLLLNHEPGVSSDYGLKFPGDLHKPKVRKEQSPTEEAVLVPPFTLTTNFKRLSFLLIALAVVVSLLNTTVIKHKLTFFVIDMVCALFFLIEHVFRIVYAGPRTAFDTFFGGVVPLSDLLSWLPSVLYAFGGRIDCPVALGLFVGFFRLLKLERYVHGLQILYKVLVKSQGILSVGGMAAACCLIFCSTLMYYSERHNPDPHMRQYYTSVPTAMWITLLNLSGEAPLADYTLFGRFVVGFLSIVAVAVFAIPVGAIGGAFEEVIGELTAEEASPAFSSHSTLPLNNSDMAIGTKTYGAIEMSTNALSSPHQYESLRDNNHSSSTTTTTNHNTSFYSSLAPVAYLQAVVAGHGHIGMLFNSISIFATLFAVLVEIIGTCEFASTPAAIETLDLLELIVVVWFTIEYVLRMVASCCAYMASPLGIVDFVATFPYYVAKGLLGASVAQVMNRYDGPLRALRLLRLLRLDAYAPSLSLIDDAVCLCWPGLSISSYCGLVMWYLFNAWLYLAEHGDEEFGENRRFRTAVSTLQYSAVLLTGDFPLVDFSIMGKFCCCCAVVVAVGIVAVPTTVLASAFVSVLQESADARRRKRQAAATTLQRLFRSHMQTKHVAHTIESNSANSTTAAATTTITTTTTTSTDNGAFKSVVKDVITYGKVLRGLDSSSPPILARLCLWKNSNTCGATFVRYLFGYSIALNILAVVLESMTVVRTAIPHHFWQLFETISVVIFTVEYAFNVLTARYDPRWKFSRWSMVTSFLGLSDLLAIVPFYIQELVLPWCSATGHFDATIFRILRLSRVVTLEKYFEAFSLLDDVIVKAAPILRATGVMALVVWVGGATIFYYVEPHSNDGVQLFRTRGGQGEDPAIFTSIVDALFYCAIFLAGEWATVDFTPIGAALCVVMALVGVALFSIPVGVLFESFQDMLAEQQGKAEEENEE